MTNIKLSDLRRDYGGQKLDEAQLPESPYLIFESWLAEAIQQNILDAQCFVLSTTDESGYPDSRIVLLKEINKNELIFYTNYSIQKGKQIKIEQHVALNFYWAALSKQVRILGTCKKTSRAVSEQYFKTRPLESQISAIISNQSDQIRDRAVLETAYNEYKNNHPADITCPENWGGYAIKPSQFEFFQGHPNRLHDRIRYNLAKTQWEKQRLAP